MAVTTEYGITKDQIEQFAAVVEQHQRVRYLREYPAAPDHFTDRYARTFVHMGRKFARVDVGDSGKYMVDLATGEIFGIKGYGVVHRGHRYGTLDTVDRYDWGDYHAQRLTA